jgi:hypothetical protein
MPNTMQMGTPLVFQGGSYGIGRSTVGDLATAFKPTVAGTKKSHVIFVLDDSASMQSCRDATISGFNEFLNKQLISEKETGIKTFISLFKFDGSNVTCSIDHVRVTKVLPLNRESYNPNGMTNLYDAMGGAFMAINAKLSGQKESKRESVIMTILTDGQDNTSTVFNSHDISKMVSKAEEAKWGFMFLGANINAFAVGGSLGFQKHNTMSYTVNNTQATMASASNMTSRLRSAYMTGASTSDAYAFASFTDDERKASGGDNV